MQTAINDYVDLIQDYREAGYTYPSVTAFVERYTKMFGTPPPDSFVRAHQATVARMEARAYDY